MSLAARVRAAAEPIARRARTAPAVGLILGSGLGSLADAVEAPDSFPYGSIPGFCRSTAPGHAGRLVLGRLEGVPVAVMQGRHHLYEGYGPADVAFPVRVLAALGCRTLIVTNAAGGLDQAHRIGDLMIIEDHLFLPGMVGFSPLRGMDSWQELGVPFVDMNGAYDPELGALARRLAVERNIRVHRGVYAMVAGPHFETPAEIRALRALGAHAVGMSTCPEVVVARHCGLRVLGISCITNLVLGKAGTTVDHEEVLIAGREAGPRFETLIRAILRNMERSP